MLWMIAVAIGAPCPETDAASLIDTKAPAVLVLGERLGRLPDLARADKVVRGLLSRGPLTVALESVAADKTSVLASFADGGIEAGALSGALDWEASWGFPWRRYEPVISTALEGATVVGAGVAPRPLPEGEQVAVPPRYLDLWRDGMGGHDMPFGSEARLVQAMAWHDHRVASQALEAWDGKGVLVILASWSHVAGGQGISWQAARQTDVPVTAVQLSATPDAACGAGEVVWR